MKRIGKKRYYIPVVFVLLIALCWPINVNACELLYVGGDMTDDGANLFMRSEEIYADDNKTYYVSPAGKHAEGEEYQGCTDFVWTFTHDSYKYTARCDGFIDGECLTCEGTHEHTPYEEAGTNDHGVTVSATNSLNTNKKIKKVDPFIDGGIEESEMATVLLSEASSAREGVELLTSIYDSAGAGYEGAGVMICDQNEQWYVENLSGHEYIAVLLPADVAFMQFNVSVLGRIDLDDTDHVIASDHLFEVAKKAGTFVGDEEENIIDYRASFNDYMMESTDDEDWDEAWKVHVQERLAAGLNFLEGTDKWTVDNVLENNDFVMSNVDENGSITSLHNQLKLKDTMSLDNALALFRVYPIGYEENVNTHLYRFYPKEEQTLGTVEWFAMDNCTYNVFVPSYPMLLTDTWEGYKVQLDETVITEKKPDKGDYYLNDGEYHIHPDGWDKSYIGTLSALTNLLTYGDLSDQEIALAEDNLQALQGEFVSRFDELSTEIKTESSTETREKIMTEADKEMAAQVHDLALALYRYYTYGEDSDLIQGVDKKFPVVPLIIVILLLAAAVAAVIAVKRRRSQ
ncbi:MAG: C69 family dipeptidase [Firmicutes bacterium]|nr:C69 family dipeptidase [Bacillota bacterium]